MAWQVRAPAIASSSQRGSRSVQHTLDGRCGSVSARRHARPLYVCVLASLPTVPNLITPAPYTSLSRASTRRTPVTCHCTSTPAPLGGLPPALSGIHPRVRGGDGASYKEPVWCEPRGAPEDVDNELNRFRGAGIQCARAMWPR